MGWRLAYSLETLRSELNTRWPHRDKSSDGAIGDTAHAASASDHNPNPQGVVCAYDVDTDLDGTDDSNDPEMDALVEHLRTHPHPNLKYVIYRARIFRSYPKPGIPPFTWSAYTKDPHISHPHISVGEGPDGQSRPGTYDDRTPWLTGFGTSPAPQPAPEDDPMSEMVRFGDDPKVYVVNALGYRHVLDEHERDTLAYRRLVKLNPAWENGCVNHLPDTPENRANVLTGKNLDV